mgnify:CR=1 FL=1
MEFADRLLSVSADQLNMLRDKVCPASALGKVQKILIRKFKENKISVEAMLQWLDGFEERMVTMEAEKDKASRENWMKTLGLVCTLFDARCVQYVLIKALNHPWAMATDLDFLILDPPNELRALETLHEEGYSFFGFRLLAHPLKIMSVGEEEGDTRIQIDFYPEPEWIRKKVCDTEVIFSRKRVSKMGVANVFVPSPEDSLYLVSTHAYSHLAITFAEMMHGLNTINEDFDWEYLSNLANNYGTMDAVYQYVKILDVYSLKYRQSDSLINQDFLKKCERNRICREIKSRIEKPSPSLTFPIEIPGWIGCVYSSLYHTKAMFGHMPFGDLIYDFASHYLALASKAIMGKA